VDSLSLARDITRVRGGDWAGSEGLIPGPGHSAKDRSMSVRDTGAGDDVVLHSFTGDDWKPVKDAMRREGLLPDRQPRDRPTEGAAYVYRDADSRPALRVVRKAGAKGFYQQHAGPGGEWITGLNGTDPLPYRLPELLAAHPDAPVYICEGEKDADNLAALGEVTTTNPGGAGKWPDSFARHLHGRQCIALADNDDPGRAHAADVAAKLVRAGLDCVTLALPGLPPKGDVSDWIAMGGTSVQLAQLTAQAFDAPVPSAVSMAPTKVLAWGALGADVLAGMKFEPLRFVVPGIMPEGLALLAGKPKFGKSFLAMDLAIAVASGGSALGSIRCEAGDVLYCALEDSQRRLHDRLHKMLPYGGIMPSRLFLETNAPRIGDGLVDQLETWLDAHPAARLIILDTWRCIKPESRGNASAYDDDASGLNPLQRLASTRPGLAVLVIHHTRKMEADDPFDTISGTHGLTGVADTLMVLARHGEVAKLSAQGRDLDSYEKAMSRDRMTGGWTMTGDASLIGRTSERQRIIDTLRDAPEPMSAQEVADLIEEPYANTRRTLARMAKNQEIGKGARGRYVYPCPNSPNVSNYDPDPNGWDNGTDGTGVTHDE
jgi:hypothetical protein